MTWFQDSPNTGRSDLNDPAEGAQEIVPSDSIDLTIPSRALWVGASGNLRVTMLGGQTVTFLNLSVGWHPIRATRIFATLTTASSIVVVW